MPTAEAESTRTDEPRFSSSQLLKVRLATAFVAVLLRLLGATWKITCSFAPGSQGEPKGGERRIFCFWHRALIPAVWCFRDRNIAVLTSRSRDGEYVSQLIERFGFRAVRGSTSRGGAVALLSLRKVLEEEGSQAAFTPDGPRGPKYEAKPGAITLARSTGVPIYCFYVACDRAWTLKSWDAMLIPKPFARLHYYFDSAISISANENPEAALHAMQMSLEQARQTAEQQVEAAAQGS